MERGDADWLRVAALLEEAAALIRELAGAPAAGDARAVPGRLVPTAPPATPSTFVARGDAERILRKVEEAGFRVKGVNDGGDDPALTQLARLIANKYPQVMPFIDELKRAQSSREMIHIDLRSCEARQISDITLLADLAHKAELLPAFRYRKSPVRELCCAPPVHPRAISFFTGEWLEIYAQSVLASCQHLARGPIPCLRRVQVSFPEGDDFELDLVALVNDRLVWVEAKTTHGFVRRLSTLRRASTYLCAQSEDAILLCAREDAARFESAVALQARMVLCTLDSLPGHLRTRIQAISNASGEAPGETGNEPPEPAEDSES